MPDKSNNWLADDGFWDAGWKDMQRQLDEHLPVVKKSRKPLFFWWVTGVAALVLFASFVAYQSYSIASEPPAQQDDVVEQRQEVDRVPAITAPEEVSSSALSNVENNSLKLQSSHSVTESKVSGYPTLSTNTPTQPALAAQRSVTPLQANRFVQENNLQTVLPTPTVAVTPTVISSAPLADAPSITTGIVTSATNRAPAAVISPIQLIAPATPLLSQVNLTTSLIDNRDLVGKIAVSKKRQTSLLFEVIGSHGTQAPGLGYGFGLVAKRQLGKDHALHTSLGFRAQRQQFQIFPPAAAANEDFTSTPISANQDSVVAAYTSYDRYLADEKSNYLSTYDLRLGLGYSYQFTPRWSLGIEVGMNYLITGFAPLLLNQITAGSAFSEERAGRLTGDNGLGFAFSQLNVTNGAMDESAGTPQVTTHRFRADLGVQIGYQLNQRLQLVGGYRTFLQPVLSSEIIKVNNQRMNVGVRVRF